MDPNNRPLPCRWRNCTEIFPDAEKLLSHCTDRHIGRKSNNNLCLDCQWEGCDVKTTKRDHITSHLKVHIAFKPYSCPTCSKSFKRPQDLKKHQKLHKEAEEQEGNYLSKNEVRIDNDPSMLSAYGSSYPNGTNIPVSPFSGSSENMVNTPPNYNNPDPSMDFYGNALNKQLPNEYNADVAQLLNNIQVDQNGYPIIPNNFANEMDLNYFNTMMCQLQGSFGFNVDPNLQNFVTSPTDLTQTMYDNNLIYQNPNMYLNATPDNNFMGYQNQQQFMDINQYNNFINQNFDPNFNSSHGYPSLDFDSFNQNLQYDANGLPLQTPTFNPYNQTFVSAHSTLLQKSFAEFEAEAKDQAKDEVVALTEGLENLKLKPTSEKKSVELPVATVDKEKLKHFHLIKLLVSKLKDQAKAEPSVPEVKKEEIQVQVTTSKDQTVKLDEAKSCKLEALLTTTTTGEDLRTVDYPSLDDF